MIKFFQKIKHRLPKRDRAIEIRGTQVFIGGEQASPGEIKRLKEEARMLSTFMLWDVFKEKIHTKAYDTALKSEGEGNISARMMIHNLDVLEKIIKGLEKVKTK